MYAGGYRTTNELLAQSEKATAIVASNDEMAIAAMSTISRAGLRVSGDVSVAGFDDIPLASNLYPSTTTVRQPIEEMGRAAVETLVETIEKRGRKAPRVDFANRAGRKRIHK